MKLSKSLFAILGVVSAMLAASTPANAAVGARSLRYQYVSLDNAIPAGATFGVDFAVTDSRSVYGTAYSCGDVACVPSIFVYKGGTITLLHGGAVGYSANESGAVGGSIVTDPVNFNEQAAIFQGGGLQVIPRLTNESTSRVLKLTDSGIALVQSVDATTNASSFYIFENGTDLALRLRSPQVAAIDMNDSGIVAGTYASQGSGQERAFRYSPYSGPVQVLNPLPTEPDSSGLAINNRGDVLGYSFVPGALERIGFWHHGAFQTSFVEGTPQFPTASNSLRWNDHGLIVVTLTNDNNSYIVPQPGVRLNLADLTTGLPVWTDMLSVNNKGDILGQGGSTPFSSDHNFLLEEVSGT